ncbi:MAG: type II toxin-antitoxin system Phd/YefM family antitoxin [Phycisphaerae bacterium]|nr:type II toxin-antitoxin system Phd/YefM family antitoxin [Phycisphaerae bacterium]
MKTYTYSQARQNLSDVLNKAKSDDVLIRRRGGDTFRVIQVTQKGSPLDIDGVNTKVTTKDILSAIRDVRKR